MSRPLIIDSTKSSSHPLAPGRFYTGKVTSVLSNGKISVSIPEIGGKFGPLVPMNLGSSRKYKVGDKVKCTFNNEFFDELIILGLVTAKPQNSGLQIEDIAESVASLTASVALLTDSLNLLVSRVEALELNIWT
jgi:hypothetical protein